MNSKPSNHASLCAGICLALAVITLATFWPVGRLGFINLDDYGKDGYIVDNVNVQVGITAESVHWAFTTAHAGNWHPVTWLSHMLDYQWFGLNASGHHWVNLAFHIANVLLLFLVLRALTHSIWRSTLVAALFALHPLRVESVAWISERKDVLSAFFFLLTLLVWTQYAQKTGRQPRTSIWYWLALLLFALGLMSKPMLVTLPLVLFILDVWPLARLPALKRGWQRFKPLVLEKIPFLALSLIAGILTLWAQTKSHAVIPLGQLRWDWRLENSLLSCVIYLKKLIWPQQLAIFYPYGYSRTSLIAALGYALVLTLFTVFCFRQRRKKPFLLVGWCWFLIMLLPVIGLVQAGVQSVADRYTYLPSIGFCMLVVWGLAAIAHPRQMWRNYMATGAIIVLFACALATRRQLSYWRDSVMLFTHALDVAGDNPVGHYYFANALRMDGKLDEAAGQYQSILQNAPGSEDIHYRLGYVLLQLNRLDEAESQFKDVLRINPENASAHMCLGFAFVMQGNFADAETRFCDALRLRPGDLEIRQSLRATLQKIDADRIINDLTTILKTNSSPEAHLQIAVIQIAQGDYQDATEHCWSALKLDPNAVDVLNNLAWLLATCQDDHIRNGIEAVPYAEHACQLTHNFQARTMGTLAAAYAQAGQFDEAVVAAQKACALASDAGEQDLVKRNSDLLELFRKHQSFIEIANP